jgi:hypothetical protein
MGINACPACGLTARPGGCLKSSGGVGLCKVNMAGWQVVHADSLSAWDAHALEVGQGTGMSFCGGAKPA